MICGEIFGLFVLYGTVAYPKVADRLPTSIDGCQFNGTSIYQLNQTLNGEGVYAEENFLLKIFHIAFLLVPVSGFLISYILGILISLATGGLKIVDNVDPLHLSSLAWYIWPKKWVPQSRKEVSS